MHDFFVSFAQSGRNLQLDGNFKWYLATCVLNRARDRIRARQLQTVGLDEVHSVYCEADEPEFYAVCNEQLQQISNAMAKLPYDQREVIMLHFQAGMTFRTISKSLGVSANTAKSRYRYGLDKLRSIFNGEVIK